MSKNQRKFNLEKIRKLSEVGFRGIVEPEPLKKKQEPEPQKIYRLLEDKKHKEIVHLLIFFRENSKFLWLKTQLFYLLYISCSFTLVVCRGKNISLNLTIS